MPTDTDLGTKTFGMNDQAVFAAWSGDHNPMHVDEVAARRLVSGRAVVHGMHTVLEALARWAPHASAPCGHLKAEFARPINVGDAVRFNAASTEGRTRLTAFVDGQAHMVLDLGPSQPDVGQILPPGAEMAPLSQPLCHEPTVWLGQTMVLPGVHGSLPVADRVAGWLGGSVVQALAQLSTLVGMVCPGLHSIFSAFNVGLTGAAEPERFRVARHEARLRLLDIDVDGPLQGRVRAFMRQPPQPQPSMAELQALLSPDAFAGSHSWVLGGSRGLGEATAKLIAAGGGDVTLTYAAGRDDALTVAAEINAAGCGRATAAHYEVGVTKPADLNRSLPRPAAVFFFATPRIARQRIGAFDAGLLSEFLRCYVEAVSDLALTLEQSASGTTASAPIRLFNPSSVFVDELPSGMVEYAMAKAAAEVLARDYNKRLRRVQIMSPRLPRMLTDQTAGLLPSKAASVTSVMLSLVQAALQGS